MNVCAFWHYYVVFKVFDNVKSLDSLYALYSEAQV